MAAGTIVQLLQAADPGASSAPALRMSVASVSGATVNLDVTATLGTAGGLAEVQYLALVGAAAGPDRCSDGQVPSVEDPPDGDTFEGLGPHEDRLFSRSTSTPASNRSPWATQSTRRRPSRPIRGARRDASCPCRP